MKRVHHRHLPLLALTLIALAAVPFSGRAQKTDQSGKIVKMTVDYGDGVQKRFTAIPWKKSMTVMDAMRWARKHRRGIKFDLLGKEETALLKQVDDLKNEGGGKRNWIYRVNDDLGDRSFAIYELDAGDHIMWRFEKYR